MNTPTTTRLARAAKALAAASLLLPVASAPAALRVLESIPSADLDIPAAGTSVVVPATSGNFIAGVGLTARWTAVTADGGGGSAPWSADLEITVTPPFATPLDWDFVGGEVSIANYPLADAAGSFIEPTADGDYTWTFSGTPSPYVAGLRDVELHYLASEPDVTTVIDSTTIGRPLWDRPFSIVGISGLGPVAYDAIEFTVPVSGLYTLDSVHPSAEDTWASFYEGEFDPTLPLTNQLDYGLGNGFAADGTPRGTAHVSALLFTGRTYTMVTSQWASFRATTDYTLTVVGPAGIQVAGECPADLDSDGSVGASDLAVLLAGWGAPGVADIDGSGSADAADLAILLAAWGECD